MKKRSIVILLALSLILLVALPVGAASPLLTDEAGLLTPADAAKLENVLQDVTARHDTSIIVVTLDSLNGADAAAYAESITDSNAYGENCILLLIAMDEGEWYIDARGFGIEAMKVRNPDAMGSIVVPFLANGDYYNGFVSFAKLCDEQLSAAEQKSSGMGMGTRLIIALVVGLVAGLIGTSGMKSQLRSVRPKRTARSYTVDGSFRVGYSRDIFLYSRLERRAKPKPQPSVQTHTSAAGNTHAGSGGKFR